MDAICICISGRTQRLRKEWATNILPGGIYSVALLKCDEFWDDSWNFAKKKKKKFPAKERNVHKKKKEKIEFIL